MIELCLIIYPSNANTYVYNIIYYQINIRFVDEFEPYT